MFKLFEFQYIVAKSPLLSSLAFAISGISLQSICINCRIFELFTAICFPEKLSPSGFPFPEKKPFLLRGVFQCPWNRLAREVVWCGAMMTVLLLSGGRQTQTLLLFPPFSKLEPPPLSQTHHKRGNKKISSLPLSVSHTQKNDKCPNSSIDQN